MIFPRRADIVAKVIFSAGIKSILLHFFVKGKDTVKDYKQQHKHKYWCFKEYRIDEMEQAMSHNNCNVSRRRRF